MSLYNYLYLGLVSQKGLTTNQCPLSLQMDCVLQECCSFQQFNVFMSRSDSFRARSASFSFSIRVNNQWNTKASHAGYHGYILYLVVLLWIRVVLWVGNQVILWHHMAYESLCWNVVMMSSVHSWNVKRLFLQSSVCLSACVGGRFLHWIETCCQHQGEWAGN